MSTAMALGRRTGFRSVVVVTGHMTDGPDRAEPRFPESETTRVGGEVGAQLDEWSIGRDDLLICGGARGGDLLGAAAALDRGATVWVFLASPPDEFEQSSVAGADPKWVERFWSVLQRAPSWTLEEAGVEATDDDRFAAVNAWMLKEAAFHAEGGQLRVLAVWDGSGAGGTGGTAEVVEAARQKGNSVAVIDPRPT
jgi:hypothetical protein